MSNSGWLGNTAELCALPCAGVMGVKGDIVIDMWRPSLESDMSGEMVIPDMQFVKGAREASDR